MIQFNSYLLTCRLKSTGASYEASTRIPTQHNTKGVQKHKKWNTKKTEQKQQTAYNDRMKVA
jgi:hypothetical protein